VSQILGQVTEAMHTAETRGGVAAADGVAFTPEQLAQMAGEYTTDEQRRIHAGLEVEAAAPQEVTFF
jgi:hypothetical protein